MLFKGYLFGALYAIICLALAFVVYKLGVPKKITRKLVHILVGFEWVILYHFMGPGWHFLSVCLFFTIVLLIAYRHKLMPMISSDGDNSPGTVYYALAMSIMALVCIFLPDMILPFGIGVICTSLGDGFAGLLGQLMTFPKNLKIFGNKTLFGTLFNLIICIVAVGIFNLGFELDMQVWHIIVIALFATELELFTGKGLDNISITLGASFLTYFLIHFSGAENYIVPIILTPIFIVFAHKKRALTMDGIIVAIIVDVIISVALGNFGFVLLLAFFLGGLITDKIKKTRKKTGQSQKNKSECRNCIQVLANSTVAVICSILYLITNEKLFVIAFVAAFSEALADTAASGVGVLSDKVFDPFRMKPCNVGVSGGMSLLGTLSSLLGAALIALLAFFFGALSLTEMAIVTLAGFLGAIFDSLLGSLLQIKYKCNVCGAIVEKQKHCGEKALKYSGFSVFTNDTVNFFGTLFAAVIAFILII